MINLSLTEEVHREHHLLEDTSKDIVNDDALWAKFQTRCRKSKEGHTNFNTQQILAEFMEERNRQRQLKAASRSKTNETSSLGDMESLGNRSFGSLDSFRSNPEKEPSSNPFEAAANTTRRFRRTTMDMLSNKFDTTASVSSATCNQPAQPPRARRQRATMPMVNNYTMSGGNTSAAAQDNTAPKETVATRQWARAFSMGHDRSATRHNMPERSIYDMARNTLEEATAASISSLPRNSSTVTASNGESKNPSISSLVGNFLQKARTSLADEVVDSDYD